MAVFFSVIVPVYNVEKYLDKCLQSIINQTISDYEVIIVDDGSQDGSRKIAEKYVEKSNVKFKIISQENNGLGAARNTGIKESKGNYLLFVDSDDWLEVNALEELKRSVKTNNADILIFDYRSVDSNNNEIEVFSGEDIENTALSLNNKSSILLQSPSACNKLFKASIFKENNIEFPVQVWFEDIRTIPKLYTFSENIFYLKKTLYNYFHRDGSIMRNKNFSRNLEIVYALDDLIKFYKNKNIYIQLQAELEFLYLYHVLTLASARVLKISYFKGKKIVKELNNAFNNNFPDYQINAYELKLNRKDRFILKLMLHEKYLIVSLLLKVKNIINGIRSKA